MSSQLQVTGEAKIRDIQGPVVANSGVITALDGAASQYVRGDGTLADFPTSSGGGSSVSYYLNSSVSQGTIGGVAYRELSKEPIIGAGTDIAISSNGYVASYLTDANDPDVLSIPGGNFNCEFYFSVNNNTGNPFFYAELYKYDGTTFTLLGSSVGVPEYINQGTIIAPYYFAIPVPTSALALTDRLAIRIYVNVDGRTVTLHTENGHLCQVVTTLSKGMVSLNNLTDQSQFLTTGTSGTNFNIASSGDTHTFNLPIASATNTGKLSSTDWSTFNGKVPYTGATASVDLGSNSLIAQAVTSNLISTHILEAKVFSNTSGSIFLRTGTIGYNSGTNAITLVSSPSVANTLIISSDVSSVTKTALIGLGSLTADRTFTLPDLSGTLALLEGTQTFSGAKTFSASVVNDDGLKIKFGSSPNLTASYLTLSAFGETGSFPDATILRLGISATDVALLRFPNTTSYQYTFPAATGTIALTSNLSAYVPYTGATANVNLGTFDLTADVITGATGSFASSGGSDTFAINHSSGSGIALNITKGGNGEGLYINKTSGSGNAATIIGTLNATTLVKSGGTSSQFLKADGSVDSSTYLTTGSAATTYVPYTGATTDVSLGNNTLLSMFVFIEGNGTSGGILSFKQYGTSVQSTTNHTNIFATDTDKLSFNFHEVGGGRQFTFNVSSITAGTTRTYTMPNASGTLALTSQLPTYGNIASSDTNSLIVTGGTGAIIGAGVTLTLLNATATNGGIVSGVAQTFGGAKTFVNAATFSSSVSTTELKLNNISALIHVSSYNVLRDTDANNAIILGNSSTPQNFYNNTEHIFRNRTGTTSYLNITSAGNVGIGNSAPLSRLNVSADNNDANSGQLVLNGTTDGNKRLSIGYNTTSNFGFISVYTALSGYNALSLQPNGGNVGIGTSAPATKTHFVGGGTTTSIANAATTVTSRFDVANPAISIGIGYVSSDIPMIQCFNNGTNAATNLSINPFGGNVVIGGTSSVYKLSIIGTGGVNPPASFASTTTNLYTAYNANGVDVGYIGNGVGVATGGSATDFGFNATNNMVFTTSSAVERMRITSGGSVLIGKTTTSFGAVGTHFLNNGQATFTVASDAILYLNRTGSDGIIQYFYKDTSIVGSISVTASLTSYNVTSDYRLKEDLKEIKGLEKLSAIKVYDFKWKADGSRMDGVIAHELAEVLPYAVQGQKDGEEMQQVDYSKLVPILVKSIQELEARIKQLENK
jgi:hypothetical protein